MSHAAGDGPPDKPEPVPAKRQRSMPHAVFALFWTLNFGGLAGALGTMLVLAFTGDPVVPDWSGTVILAGFGLWILTLFIVEIFGAEIQKKIIFGTMFATFALAIFAGLLFALLSYPFDEGLIPDELQQTPDPNP